MAGSLFIYVRSNYRKLPAHLLLLYSVWRTVETWCFDGDFRMSDARHNMNEVWKDVVYRTLTRWRPSPSQSNCFCYWFTTECEFQLRNNIWKRKESPFLKWNCIVHGYEHSYTTSHLKASYYKRAVERITKWIFPKLYSAGGNANAGLHFQV